MEEPLITVQPSDIIEKEIIEKPLYSIVTEQYIDNKNVIINESNNKTNNLDNWLGNYFYSVQFKHSNVEGAYYVIVYTILIYKEENNYYAKFINDGWQTETRTLARIVGDENEIEIIFIETLPEDGLSEGLQRYKENEILLKLMQGEAGLITSWYALRKEQPDFFESMEENIPQDSRRFI